MKSPKWIYVLGLLVFAYFAGVIFIPLFLSIFSAMLIDPIVTKLSRRGIPRHYTSFIIMVLFLGLVAATGWLVYVSFSSLSGGLAQFPDKIHHFTQWVGQMSQRFDLSPQAPGQATGEDVQKVQMVNQYSEWAQYAMRGLGSLYDTVSIGFFFPLLLFYFLYDKEILVKSFNECLKPYFSLDKINSELPKMIRAFATANVATLGFLVVTHGLTLCLLGFKHWLSLTVVTALASLVPLVGPVLAIILPITQGLTQGAQTYPFVLMALIILSLHLIANSVILPQAAGLKINVNSAAMALGLLFWGWLWGWPLDWAEDMQFAHRINFLMFQKNLMAAKPLVKRSK